MAISGRIALMCGSHMNYRLAQIATLGENAFFVLSTALLSVPHNEFFLKTRTQTAHTSLGSLVILGDR